MFFTVGTEAQYAFVARHFPASVDPRDAIQFEMVRRRHNALLDAVRRAEAAEMAEMVAWSDERMADGDPFANGWFDVEWDEFVPSESRGTPVEGFDFEVIESLEKPAVGEFTISHYRLGAWLVATQLAQWNAHHLLHASKWLRIAAGHLADALVPARTGRKVEVKGKVFHQHYRPFVVNADAKAMDEAEADEILAWLGRDPSDEILATEGAVVRCRSVVGRGASSVLSRWNRPEDEQEFMVLIREHGLEEFWTDCMTEFRRVKLHRTLQAYFGLDQYQSKSIVLKWEKTSRGKWLPVEQAPVVEWIERSVAYAGSRLGGYQSCTTSLVEKAKRQGRRVAVSVPRFEMEEILTVALHKEGFGVPAMYDEYGFDKDGLTVEDHARAAEIHNQIALDELADEAEYLDDYTEWEVGV